MSRLVLGQNGENRQFTEHRKHVQPRLLYERQHSVDQLFNRPKVGLHKTCADELPSRIITSTCSLDKLIEVVVSHFKSLRRRLSRELRLLDSVLLLMFRCSSCSAAGESEVSL